MDCNCALELLSPYVDDLLDEAEAGALRSHLDACAACGEACAQLLRIREALLSIPDVPLPEGFDERLRQALARSSEEAPAGAADRLSRAAKTRSRRNRRLWSSAAAVFAIGLLSLFVYSRIDLASFDSSLSTGGAAEIAPQTAEVAQGTQEAVAEADFAKAADRDAGEARIDYVADAGAGAALSGAEGDDESAAADDDRLASANASAEAAPPEQTAGATAEQLGLYDRHDLSAYPARGTTTSAHRLNEKSVCDELLREKLAGWNYELLWEEKRDGAWIYRVKLNSNEAGTDFNQEVEIVVSAGKAPQVYYATEFMGF
ncbi:MAG: zf-HC2 domain-containing protein [Clostridiales Family XIII bacterium]|jgi:anti-sigma factor RsiW|nr:zf-HC2 domain-containing protein [Clostridiales Family XIII bacterium]